MRQIIQSLLRDNRGATAIEYGLIAGLIAIVTIASLTTLGTSLNTEYGNINTTVAAA